MKTISAVVFLLAILLAFFDAKRCVAEIIPMYSPPPGWLADVGPDSWTRGKTDIHFIFGPMGDRSDTDVAARLGNKRVPPGWTIIESHITDEHGCFTKKAWWIRETFLLPRGRPYREISLEYEKGSLGVILLYDLRSSSEKEDPTVLASFLDFCKLDL